jgi:hypothetical protein
MARRDARASLAALGALLVVSLAALACIRGDSSSVFSNTSWRSTTVVPQAMRNGVTATTWTLHFGAATTQSFSNSGDTATGPLSYTYVETYGPTNAALNGCVITATCMGTWNETAVSPTADGNTAMGTIAGTGTTCTCTAAACDDQSRNGAFTSGCSFYAANGYTENFSINNSTLNNSTLTLSAGDSSAPYHASGDNYTFVPAPSM